MKRLQFAVNVALVAAVAATAILFFFPTEAIASCFYPKRVVITYIGYEVDGQYQCNHPQVSPPIWPTTTVGEHITECDGTVTQWGIVCDNKTTSRTTCPDPICD